MPKPRQHSTKTQRTDRSALGLRLTPENCLTFVGSMSKWQFVEAFLGEGATVA